MRHFWRTLGALTLLLVVVLPSAAAPGQKPANDSRDGTVAQSTEHNLSTPWSEKQDALREAALAQKLAGKASAQGEVVNVARVGKKAQYVELARLNTDRVFAIIAEFGTTRHASFCDAGQACAFPGDGSAITYEGPEHNKIPAPDRATDNSTLWQADYSTAHYENMYFNRMRAYYERQSSGRYSIVGDVNGWVKVPFNEARYGRNFCGGIVCNNTWFLIRDALAYWVQGQIDAGQTPAQISAYLQTFDKQDRYDSDEDGEFNEPDGFIDHFQIVHAGGDEASGDDQQGTDAIWSHRWYAQIHGGSTDPEGTGPNGFPGVNIGRGGVSSGVTIPSNPTGVWVGDYTIQPENGGLGVFAHEFAHDLGLPDLYDTSGNTGGAENSTGFWTLMSSGANLGDGGPNGIGDAPPNLGAWEKLQLGWLNYTEADSAVRTKIKLGPSGYNSSLAQAAVVNLPDKRVLTELGAPFEGANYYYSNAADNLDNYMTKAVTLAAPGTLTAKVRYQIELDWDYAYVVMSADNGATWTNVATNLSSAIDPNGQNLGFGITGSTAGAWVDLTAALPAGSYLLGFRYVTDGAAVEPGISIDNVSVAAGPIDGAEGATTFTFSPPSEAGGFRITTGTEESFHLNAYIVENRPYLEYDRSLATAYNFGFLNTLPNWVEHFPYQDGVLISYWDTSQNDNNVGDHPGAGLILPIDANPLPLHWADGQLIRPRIQSFDSTFSTERYDAITVNKDGVPVRIPSKRGVDTFDDSQTWWSAGDGHTPESHGRYQVGWIGVNPPTTGTTIRVKQFKGRYNEQANIVVRPSSISDD